LYKHLQNKEVLDFMTGMLTQQLEQVDDYLADGDFTFEYTAPGDEDDDEDEAAFPASPITASLSEFD
jgi:hypothetical protein